MPRLDMRIFGVVGFTGQRTLSEKVAPSDHRQLFCHRKWSPAIVCFRERELCGFVQGHDIIIPGDSVQMWWVQSRLNEGLVLRGARF